MFKSILEAGDLKGKKVLVRVDWSVPTLSNDFQIKATLPTLKYLEDKGAKIIIATHTEGVNVTIEDLKKYVPAGAEILPNLRDNPGEKGNSEEFARELASKADVYVNEAFAVSHREHASIVSVPKFIPGFIGLEFTQEIEHLSKAFTPPKPFLLILGGAKFETKLPIVEKFLPSADSIFIGGGMAKAIVGTALEGNPKLFFCIGDVAAIDANEETIKVIKEKIDASNFILWNGPLGNYEKGYKEGTLGLAKILAESGKEVIVGGGDTLAAIKELGIEDKFTFVSTAGGAMLDFLANGTLPGIEALKK